jgi:hypothetical protein
MRMGDYCSSYNPLVIRPTPTILIHHCNFVPTSIALHHQLLMTDERDGFTGRQLVFSGGRSQRLLLSLCRLIAPVRTVRSE